MPLSDVEGQGRALEALRRAVGSGRLHHAYLFVGPDGVGKSMAAFGLAESLLGEDEALDPLDRACARVAARQHPDLHVLERREKSPGVLETFIRIDQIRALQHELSLKSFEGRRRVVLILQAERMNASTANALLKTLEEPGQGTHFVLVSHAPNLLLPTILSRCQRVRFAPLPRPLVARLLLRHADLDDERLADLVAGLSEGSLTKGLELAASPLLEERAELIEALDPPQPTMGALLDTAKQLAGRKAELPLIFHMLRTWLRDLLLVQEGLGSDRLVHRDLIDRARRRAAQVPAHVLLARLDLANETERAITLRSANARLSLEAMLLGFVAR